MREKLEKLHRQAFNYFYESACKNDIGYGLIYDQSDNKDVATIAGSGFFLSAIISGVERKYIDYEEGKNICIKAIQTLIKLPHYKGFIAHFIEINTLERYKKCEYSTIDTALCLNGCLVVQSYFKDEKIDSLVDLLMDRVDWLDFVTIFEGKKYIAMSYNPDKDGAYTNGKPGYIHRWNMTAEQLMMYIMLANKLDIDLSKELYNNFDRPLKKYNDIEYVISPGNALFVYQFPLVYLGDKDLVDENNFSWFNNTKSACLANYEFCQDNIKEFGFIKDTFGLSASHGINGYSIYHSLPTSSGKYNCDGTISFHGILGSLPFLEEKSLKAIEILLENENVNKGIYGFYDSYNNKLNWNSDRYYSIDKGLELLGLDCYLYKTVSNYYMNNKYIKNGLQRLGFSNGDH